MSQFYKKQTLIRTISFMAFFVAINVVCSFLTVVLPLLGLILIILLPLTSAVVEVYCKDRWFPIYAFATIGLSIVVTLSSIDFTIFYVVPSIFTGYIFGLFAKKHLPSMYAIFIATIIQTLLSFAFIPLIELITGTNLIMSFAKILRISDIFLFKSLILLIFFIVSLIQTILSFIVVKNELTKITQETLWTSIQEKVSSYSALAGCFLAIGMLFIYVPVCYLLVGVSFYFAVFVIIEMFKNNNRLGLILASISLFAELLLFALLNRYFSDGKEFILLLIAQFMISMYSICCSFLKKSS